MNLFDKTNENYVDRCHHLILFNKKLVISLDISNVSQVSCEVKQCNILTDQNIKSFKEMPPSFHIFFLLDNLLTFCP